MTTLFSISILSLLINIAAVAQPQQSGRYDKTIKKAGNEVLQVLENFQLAIINGNREKASKLLSDDARILESGSIETKKEYLSHHFSADGNFLQAMNHSVVSRKVNTTENSAWISTVSRMEGTYNNHNIKMDSAELVVLVKENEIWRISAIHWSSRNRNF